MSGQELKGGSRTRPVNGTKDVAIYLFGTPTDPHNLKRRSKRRVFKLPSDVFEPLKWRLGICPLPVKDVGLVMSHRKHMEAFGVRGKVKGVPHAMRDRA